MERERKRKRERERERGIKRNTKIDVIMDKALRIRIDEQIFELLIQNILKGTNWNLCS